MESAKILLVDDSSTNNLLFSNVLTDFGYEVKVSYNATRALEVIEKEYVDLILLDMVMPGMSGIDFMQKMNQMKRTFPVIVVTSIYNQDIKSQAMDYGAYDYLVKPVDVNDLIIKVQNVLNKTLEIRKSMVKAIGMDK